MKHRKLLFGFLSFLIPFVILFIVFLFNGLFDKHLIIKGDIYAQVFPLLNYLKGMLNGSNSIFYTFYKNLGGTMYGTFFYYLSSPFNLFIKFIESEDIPLFFMWLAVIKMSLCGFTMYLYMTYKNKKSDILILTFSVCYALMGYNMNFFVNIMWLDVVMLAPIVLIGLDKLIDGKSPLLYIVSLFISIVCNYYIAYMLCIFCLIYFIYEVILRNFDKKQVICVTKRFVIVSLFIGLMCSFILIPCFFESRNYFRSLNLKNIFSFNYNIFDVFSKTYVGSANFMDLFNYSSINLYCGVLAFLLVYLFLVNKNISKKKRILTLSVIVFMILPCFVFPLNYVWHLFSSPYLCCYRYSFLLCFFFLNIAYESYQNLEINKRFLIPFILVYFSISMYFILTSFVGYYNFINYINIGITFLFLIVYLLMLNKRSTKIYLLCLFVFIEVIISSFMTFNNKLVFSKRDLINEDYMNVVSKYKSKRIEFTEFLTYNDSILMEYYGVNNFLSTNNNRVMRFFTQAAYKSKYIDQNIYYYKGQQYISDSIIGLKYIISSYEIEDYNLIEKVNMNGEQYYVYENPNYLGIGYMVKSSCDGIDFDYYYDQKVFNCIFDKDYSFYYSLDENGKKDYNEDNFNESNTYYFDNKKYKSAYKSINKEVLDYEIVGNKIYGDINTNGGILMLAIPYEKGFNIKVDGKSVNYIEVLDTFVGINLDKGEHDIVVEYSQPYLKEGICVSFISLLALVFYLRKKY